MKPSQKASLTSTIKEASEVFKQCAKKTKILASLAWGPEVALEFFRRKESALPEPKYAIDRKTLQETSEALELLAPRLKGTHPVHQWLQRTRESYLAGVQLLLEVEKPSFFEISSSLYGNSQSRPYEGTTSNQELSVALFPRLSSSAVNDIGESLVEKSAPEFAADLEARLATRDPHIAVRVEITDQIVSKIAAGATRVRIRRDARFSALELDSLWLHEIESHCLTAHNGAAQQVADFLVAGGPRTTMTQEGLAVFFEMYGHSMSQRRLISLCRRVDAIRMVEQGADFMQLYRWHKEYSESDLEAFYSTQRIFRGGVLGGGAPFTKDVVYLAGLFGVYNYLRIAVKQQNRLLVEMLVCGRIALEDVGALAWLRTHGILSPPKFVPDWLKNWESLLSSFSFGAFLSSVDLSTYQDYFQNHHALQEWDLSIP